MKQQRIALLLCDEVAPDLGGEYGTYPEMFSHLLSGLEFSEYRVFKNEFPESVKNYDVYVVGGSRHSAYDQLDWIHQLREFIREIYWAGRWYVGICFGHQMLADALGGTVQKASTGWCVSAYTHTIIKEKTWMQPKKKDPTILMMCQDQVTAVPAYVELLAEAPDCPIAMMQIGRMLGIQGHPEFSPGYTRALIEQRRERIGTAKAERGLEALGRPLDQAVLSAWIKRFITAPTV